MGKFTFTPSATKVANGKGQDVEYDITGTESVWITINGTGLPVASVDYLIAYGLKQSLADSYSAAKNQADFDAMLGKRMDKLFAGKMSVREGSGPSDPFEVECIRIAKAKLDAWAAEKDKKLPKRDSEEYAAMLAKARTGWANSIEAEAKRRLAEAAEVGDLDLDFDEPEAEAPAEVKGKNSRGK